MIADRGGTAIGRYVAAPRERPGLPISLPPRPPLLAGREDQLIELHALLSSGAPPRTVVLCGLGGVGKTSVAAEYAHRHLTEVGIAWQVPAEDPAVLAADLAELAAQLGAREVADPRDPVQLVHAVLAAFPGEWLLVFDNAVDEASVRRFLPPAGRGRVLITSQSQHWPGMRALDVPVLDREVAAGFLVNRTADPDQAASLALADELGGLPLALEQAASYMQAAGITLGRYLALFRQRRSDLLDRGETPGHRGTVAATISLAVTRLHESAPAAVGLLRLLACLAPEPVPLNALLSNAGAIADLDRYVASDLAPLLGDDLAAGDAVAELRRYSMITPAGPGMVLMHRLVQAVTLDQIPDAQVAAWREATALLIEAAIPASPEQPGTWAALAALLPHAQSVLADDSAGMESIAHYLYYTSQYAAARDLQQRIVDARQLVLGPDHENTLASREWLALSTSGSGDEAGARDLYVALLADCERILGSDHQDTLTTRRDLANWTGRAGDPAGARDLYAALLADCERILGSDHQDTLTTRDSLAWQTGQAGDPAGARDLYTALLADRLRILGPDHQDTLTTRDSLAWQTGQAGDPAGARDLYTALLADRLRILGPDHQDTLTTRDSLAWQTGQAGDPAGARDLYTALLADRLRILGPDHEDTLATRRDLAYWTKQAPSN